jgi:DNA repair photolyase
MKNNTGTREWADSNVNFITGCANDCNYSDAMETCKLLYELIFRQIKHHFNIL